MSDNMIGSKIRQRRKDKGYSLEKLAEVAASSKSYIWELENKYSRNPSVAKLDSIAQALDVTLEYLLNDTSDLTKEARKNIFFRKFNTLCENDKKKIEQMIDLWGC